MRWSPVPIFVIAMLGSCQTSMRWQLGGAAGGTRETAAPPAVSEPDGAGAARRQDAGRAAEDRARQQREAARSLAERYDGVLDAIDEGDELVKSKHIEAAMPRYRDAQAKAAELVDWFADDGHRIGRGAKVQYATQHDGKLDEAALVANLRDAGQRAGDKADATWKRVVVRLAKELGARSKGQRDLLRERGRPEVQKTKRETCWTYRAADADDTFCWRKTGALARHDRKPKAAPVEVARVSRQPPRHASAPVVAAATDDTPTETAAAVEAPAAAPEPAPSEPAAAPSNLAPATPGWSYWRKPGDCRAVLNHNDAYCETGDCKAILNHNDAYCDTGDCKAILTHNDAYCGTGDCKAEISHNDAYCDSGDCKALITKNDAYCNTGSCKAILTHNDAYCDRESP